MRLLLYRDLEVTDSYTDEEGTATFELSELSTDERMGVRLTTAVRRKNGFATLSRGTRSLRYKTSLDAVYYMIQRSDESVQRSCEGQAPF